LDKNGVIDNTETFEKDHNLNHDALEPVIKSLTAEEYISLEVIERREIELTEEGSGYAQDGSPEYQFVNAMQMGEQVDMNEMENRVGK
jgi:predicted transcriptional regulator